MSTSQDTILQSIRSSLKNAHLPSAASELPAPPYAFSPMSPEDMVASFERELTPLRGKVHRAAGRADAIEIVMELLNACGGQDVLAWDDNELPLPELGNIMRSAGYHMLDAHVPSEAIGQQAKMQELGRAAAGVTGALAGFADTGTLVVNSNARRPRLASLLPPTHIAVLDSTKLFPNQPAFWAAHEDVIGSGANLVFITGPSRTADIELIPTFGVHGPKALHVVIV